MATRQYTLARDGHVKDVAEAVGSAINGTGFIELTIDLAADATEREVTNALENFTRKIIEDNYPPA